MLTINIQAVVLNLPNYDEFLSNSKKSTKVYDKNLLDKLHPVYKSNLNTRANMPSFLWLNPNTQLGKSVKVINYKNAEKVARDTLAEYSDFYNFTAKDLADIQLKHITKLNQAPIQAIFIKYMDGIEVYGERMVVTMSGKLQPVSISGYLPDGQSGLSNPKNYIVNAATANQLALQDLSGQTIKIESILNNNNRKHGYQYFDLDPKHNVKLANPNRWNKVVFRASQGLEPAYYIEVDMLDDNQGPQLFSYIISAVDGEILQRRKLTFNLDFSYKVWAQNSGEYLPDDGPHGSAFTPHPTGNNDFIALTFISPQLITLPHASISTMDPWLADLATETSGNNVDAYADLSAPDGFSAGDLRANTTSANTFDREFNLSLEPNASDDQVKASVTHLFYVNNYLHDWFYDAGFDEAAGNAQIDNYGRGGNAGDPILAQGQDYSGLNNANMSTPADGSSPRMQMYNFNSAGLKVVTVNGVDYNAGVANWEPTNFSINDLDIVIADDGDATNGGSITDGCQSIVNDVTGKIVLIDRGNCTFLLKVENAQAAGANGVIIANNTAGAAPGMAGTSAAIVIGTLSVSQADGNSIKSEIPNNVLASINRATSPQIDGSLDTQIVAHEWGHYLTNRLSQLGTTQARGMGEGWGDYIALMLAFREGDDINGVYAAGGYATASAYFGIRRYPYSSDFSKNPLTFKHISDGEALPVGPATNANGAPNSEVHNSGEIWASMLWQAYMELMKETQGASPRLSFTEAQTRMKRYIVAGLQASPSNPTFTEVKDSIIAAAYATDADDFIALCSGFAQRGAGTGAVSPGRNSTDLTGVIEDFNCGSVLNVKNVTLIDDEFWCGLPNNILDGGEIGILAVNLENFGGATLTNTTATITSTNLNVSFPDGNVITFGSIDSFQSSIGTLKVSLDSMVTGIQDLPFSINYSSPDQVDAGPNIYNFNTLGHLEVVEASSTSDEFEGIDTGLWMVDGDPQWTRVRDTIFQHYWHGDDTGSTTDIRFVSPALNVSGPFSMTFDHSYQFEPDPSIFWDGGVIELSSDAGTTWVDIGSFATQGGYDGQITDTSGNVLGNRMAFSGESPGYPAYISETIDLGSSYDGQTVQVRFRIGTDLAVGAEGWNIDNVSFSGISNTPFNVFSERTTCDDLIIPIITLLGDNPQSFEAGSTYVELGATAEDNVDGNITNQIIIDASAINMGVVNDYLVTYNVQDAAGNDANQKTRTVSITPDVTKPIITLVGDNPQTFEVGSSYIELGATASDNLDGDLTNSIQIDASAVNMNVVDSYTVTYNLEDAAGNIADQVVRTVNVTPDVTKPVITLIGDNPQIFEVGSSYIELGATASDNIDGDISNSIVIDSSAVNMNVVNSYSVTYDVEDAAGNHAIQVTRTVNVEIHEADLGISKTDAQASFPIGDPITYMITVTNDGPSDVIEARVQDILSAEFNSLTASWICVANMGASCDSSGEGSIDELVDIPMGGSVNFALTVSTLDPEFEGPISNVATVSTPINNTDSNQLNNIASDSSMSVLFMNGFEDPLDSLRLWLEKIISKE